MSEGGGEQALERRWSELGWGLEKVWGGAGPQKGVPFCVIRKWATLRL